MLDIFRTLRESYCGLPPQWGCAVNGTAVAEVLIDQSFSFIILPIEWHHYWWCLMTCCLKSFCLTYNMYYLQYVYTDQKPHVTCNFNCFFSKMKDFRRLQSVMYTVNVVISLKRCQIASLLLQTTNRKGYMVYRIQAILIILRYLQGYSLLQAFYM